MTRYFIAQNGCFIRVTAYYYKLWLDRMCSCNKHWITEFLHNDGTSTWTYRGQIIAYSEKYLTF